MADKSKRILVIDDERTFSGLLRTNLERLGAYEVREENDSRKALEVAREFKPNLILLDVVMPNVDGGQVLAALQADKELKGTPVIFLTATISRHGLDARGKTIANFPFLAKPFDLKELDKLIKKCIK